MRLATIEHLIAAEDAADAVAGRLGSGELADLDLDGRDEIRLATPGQTVVVKLDAGGGIGDWDVRPARHALGAVLRRRPEAYHATLRAHEERLAAAAAIADGNAADVDATGASGAEATENPAGETPASIHDLVATKDPGLAGRLHYDWHERRSGLVHLFAPATTLDAWADAAAPDLGDFTEGIFEVTVLAPDLGVVDAPGLDRGAGGRSPLVVRQRFSVGGGRLDPRLEQQVVVENPSGATVEARLGVEWATTMLGGGGNPAAWWEVAASGRATTRHGRRRASSAWPPATTTSDRPGDRGRAAGRGLIALIETVSQLGGRLRARLPGQRAAALWPVRLAPGESTTVRIAHAVAATVDRAADEGLPIPTDA
jgi:hypothetical protein